MYTAPVGWSDRIWGRTGCNFDRNGNDSCQSGNCGPSLKCGASGKPPATLVEFTLAVLDFYDVSLVNGFNLPMVVTPINGRGNCSVAGCDSDLRTSCPSELSVKGGGGRTVGCRSACDVFNTDEYCCMGVYGNPVMCQPTYYSRMFKQACPTAYSYAYDDPTSIFTCSGTDYVTPSGVVPLHTWILISNFKLAYNVLRRPDGTFNRCLSEYLDRKVTANSTLTDGVYSFDVVDRPTNLLSRVYLAAGGDPDPGIPDFDQPLSTSETIPVIVFFHGGSFVHSSANNSIYDIFCRRLVSSCGAAVVSVDYRRSPEHRYPSAHEDGWAALKWVESRKWLKSGNSENTSKVHIYLAGDSSGGNIVHQ